MVQTPRRINLRHVHNIRDSEIRFAKYFANRYRAKITTWKLKPRAKDGIPRRTIRLQKLILQMTQKLRNSWRNIACKLWQNINHGLVPSFLSLAGENSSRFWYRVKSRHQNHVKTFSRAMCRCLSQFVCPISLKMQRLLRLSLMSPLYVKAILPLTFVLL